MSTLEKLYISDIDGELRRFTGEEYLKLGAVGVLPGQGDEMLDGIVVVRGSEKPWHWTCADYDRMYEAGIIGADERVELIDGEVIALAPIGPEHMEAMTRLTRLLMRLEDAYGSDFCVISR